MQQVQVCFLLLKGVHQGWVGGTQGGMQYYHLIIKNTLVFNLILFILTFHLILFGHNLNIWYLSKFNIFTDYVILIMKFCCFLTQCARATANMCTNIFRQSANNIVFFTQTLSKIPKDNKTWIVSGSGVIWTTWSKLDPKLRISIVPTTAVCNCWNQFVYLMHPFFVYYPYRNTCCFKIINMTYMFIPIHN